MMTCHNPLNTSSSIPNRIVIHKPITVMRFRRKKSIKIQLKKKKLGMVVEHRWLPSIYQLLWLIYVTFFSVHHSAWKFSRGNFGKLQPPEVGEKKKHTFWIKMKWKIMRINRMSRCKRDRQLKLVVNGKLNDKTEGLIHSGAFYLLEALKKTSAEASID